LGLYGSGNEIGFGILTDSVYTDGGPLELTTSWAAGGGFEYFWTRNFSSTIYGGYTRTEYNNNAASMVCSRVDNNGGACDPNCGLWQIGTHHDWFPVAGLRFAVDVLYTGVDTAFGGQTILPGSRSVRARRYYLAKIRDLSVMFRAQRSWGGN
jgi:hypothetical protein